MPVAIREVRPEDAAAVGRLIHEFQDYLRGLGDTTEFVFDADVFLRDGFGPDRAFEGIVAEYLGSGGIIGYLLYTFSYDTDRALRQLFVIDLYVTASARRGGAGRLLMEEARRIARARGAGELTWSVFHANDTAFGFYEALGARHITDLRFMALKV